MTVVIIMISIIAILMIYCRIETKLLKLTVYTAESRKIPDDLAGRRIVLLSDLHNTYFGDGNARLLKMIKVASPDIIIIAGDLINGRSRSDQFKYASDMLSCLSKMNIPVYYAFGNHEYRLDGCFNNEGSYKRYCEMCDKLAILTNNRTHTLKLKDNSSSDVNDSKCVDGARISGIVFPESQFLPEAKYSLEKPISSFIGDADTDRYNILIAHDPTYFDDYIKWGADLVVSGHIHGGIIRLPLIGGLISPRYCLFPKYDKGVYRNEDGRMMVVSGGIGWHTIPFRFLNRPEVVAIDLVKIS